VLQDGVLEQQPILTAEHS